MICTTQYFNILQTGKVPSNTPISSATDKTVDHDLGTFNDVGSQADSKSFPRSLILFWLIENNDIEIFKYLWSEIPFINWGVNNLEWLISVACYNRNLPFITEILLSTTFSSIIRSLPFEEAMDFLEEYVIHNEEVEDSVLEELLGTRDLLIYNLIG